MNMTAGDFYRLLKTLAVAHPDNRALDAQIRSIDRVGAPSPMTDAARHRWRRDVLIVSGLRSELHRIPFPTN